MSLFDLLSISVSAILRHKVRSALTLIGIIIGIISFATITSIVRGIDAYVQRIFAMLGSDTIVVTTMGIITDPDEYLEALKRRPLDPKIAERISKECKSVAHVSPFIATTTRVKAWRSASDIAIRGANEDIQFLSEGELHDGRFFSPYEIERARNVCVIGWGVLEDLFQTDDVLGREIYIKGHRFTIVGVVEKSGGGPGVTRDATITIPFTTFEKIFGRGHWTTISAKAADIARIEEAVDEIRATVRKARGLRGQDKDDFGIVTASSLRATWKSLTSQIFLGTIAVGGIALLVGGIGIMNIMLVSVKERTMEIGLRKATGATRRNVMFQFLVESILLCLAGGFVGIAIGLSGTSLILRKIGVPFSGVWEGAGIGFATALAVGVFFGVYPAYKAAGLEPNDALRYGQ